MQTWRTVALGVLCTVLATGRLPAQEVKPAEADDAKLRQELAQIGTRRPELTKLLAPIHDRAAKADAVVALAKAAEAARQAYIAKRDASPAVIAGRKALDEARAAADKAAADKLAADVDVKAAQAKLKDVSEKRLDLQFKQALAEFHLNNSLSPIARKVEADPAVVAARAELEKTKDAKAYNEKRQARKEALPEAKPFFAEVAAAKEAIAKLALEDGVANAAINAAREKVRKSDDPALVAARQKASDADKAYNEALKAPELAALAKAATDAETAKANKIEELFRADPEAVPLLKEKDQLDRRSGEILAHFKKQSQPAAKPPEKAPEKAPAKAPEKK